METQLTGSSKLGLNSADLVPENIRSYGIACTPAPRPSIQAFHLRPLDPNAAPAAVDKFSSAWAGFAMDHFPCLP